MGFRARSRHDSCLLEGTRLCTHLALATIQLPRNQGCFIVPVEIAITINVHTGNALGIADLVVTRAVRELPISLAVRLKCTLPFVCTR